MEEKKKFDKLKYDYEYRKEHYKEFRAFIDKLEFEKLEQLLKEKGLTKVDFLKKAIEELQKK